MQKWSRHECPEVGRSSLTFAACTVEERVFRLKGEIVLVGNDLSDQTVKDGQQLTVVQYYHFSIVESWTRLCINHLCTYPLRSASSRWYTWGRKRT